VLRLGLTGNVGAGKSTVVSLFASWGATVIDSDVLAREVVETGQPALTRIGEVWGDAVLHESGRLDRAAMRRIVFSDPEAREQLESILHPAIRDRARELLLEAEARGDRIVVGVVPLLYEVGLEGEYDAILLIDAPVELRIVRLVSKRGLSVEEARAVAAAQMPAEEKRARADFIIDNDSDITTLERRAWETWKDLHIHTRASHDCLSGYSDVVAAARARGLHRIAVTDHNEIEGAFRARDLAPDLVIVGEEVKTAEGVDITGLFLTEKIPKRTAAMEAVHAIREQGGLVYIPHPFADGKGLGEDVLESIEPWVDVVEIFNARIHKPALNEKARVWAAERDLPGGAGSDAHTLREIGRGVIEVPSFDGKAEFLEALRRGRVVGRSSSHLVHVASTWAKIAGKFS
jgi:dephospho-CoA kinase